MRSDYWIDGTEKAIFVFVWELVLSVPKLFLLFVQKIVLSVLICVDDDKSLFTKRKNKKWFFK
jgi:hypothetical protein